MNNSSGYAGAEWLKRALKNIQISEFGVKVAELLGDLYYGIYHVRISKLRKVDWKNDRWIEIVLPDTFSTFDADNLTRLVVLCHDRLIRCEIRGAGPGHTKL